MNNCCILQVDDDSNDVFLLHYAMTKVGLANPLHVAEDGKQAVAYLAGAGAFADRSKFPIPGLVLLDLKLPGLPGHEVLKWMQAHPQLGHWPTIVLSSSEDAGDIERAYQLGANSYIVKPMGIDEWVELARALSCWWLKYNRFPTQTEAGADLKHVAWLPETAASAAKKYRK